MSPYVPDPNALSILLALAGKAKNDWFTPGLARLVATHDLTSTARGVATFDSVPTPERVRALQKLGLDVQPMTRVALANVTGPVSAMRAAVRNGLATDAFPDERLDETARFRRDAPRRIAGRPAAL